MLKNDRKKTLSPVPPVPAGPQQEQDRAGGKVP